MLSGCEVRLYPTDDQLTLIRKSGGCCRFLYNMLLDYEMHLHETENRFAGEFELNEHVKSLKAEYVWLTEVNAQALQQVSKHVVTAYRGFFEKRTGFPKYKAKHRNNDTFTNPQHCRLDFRHKRIVIPKVGAVKAVFPRKVKGTLRSITISIRPSGHIYASLLMDDGRPEPTPVIPDDPVVLGIDMGLKELATCSDGTVYHNVRSLKRHEKQLKHLSRELSRKQKGSRNRDKARRKLARLHERISDIRSDHLHKVSHAISESQTDVIAIEDLNVKGMMRNRCLSKAIADASLGELGRLIEYKCRRNGKTVVKVSRFAASTQTCSVCGYANRDLRGGHGAEDSQMDVPGVRDAS